MRRISENRESAVSMALMAIALLVLAAFLMQGLGSDAEAVLGGQGNLGSAGPNHPHNFSASSNYARAVGEDRICIFCHTPHHAVVNVGPSGGKTIMNAPLWNHELSDVSYTVKTPGDYTAIGNTFTLLSSVTDKPDGASRLCLSCHDGEVSIGAIYSRLSDIAMADACLGTDGSSEVSGLTTDSSGRFGALFNAPGSECMAYIGTDLRSKHVVSVAMNTDLIGASVANCVPPTGSGSATMYLQYPWQGSYGDKVLLRPTAETFNGNQGVTYPTGSMPASKYKSGYNYGVQCSTCHDPHYWTATSGAVDSEGERMLVESFNNLCTSCHIDCP